MIASLISGVEWLGSSIRGFVSSVGSSYLFLFRVFLCIVTPPFNLSLLVRQIYHIGVQSLSVIVLVGAFTGAVMAVQGVHTMSKFGATAYTGSIVALSLLRELGPVLTALMVYGRAGSSVTAELGIMKISEQVDALRSMSVDPIRHLMAPRLVASLISVPLLAAIFSLVGIAGGYLVAVGTLGLPSGTFTSQMLNSVGLFDVLSGISKSFVFAFTGFWIACYRGWTCGFGAVGVNRATTSTVVTASVMALVMDYFLSSILTVVFH